MTPKQIVRAELNRLISEHGLSWYQDLTHNARMERLMSRLFFVILQNSRVAAAIPANFILALHDEAASAIYPQE
jgi:hypothetical protein